MSSSKCPKCDNSTFELSENSPSKSSYKLLFVQCKSCGCVVGAMDYYNIGARITELEKKIDNTAGLSSVINNLNIVNSNIANLFNFVKRGFENIEASNNKK